MGLNGPGDEWTLILGEGKWTGGDCEKVGGCELRGKWTEGIHFKSGGNGCNPNEPNIFTFRM